MSDESIRKIITAARFVAAAALIVQSILFLRHAQGSLEWIVGGAEIVAAILFLIPATQLAGATTLIVIFAFAATVHRAIWLVYPALLVLVLTVSARRTSTT